jgi:gluconolactonase
MNKLIMATAMASTMIACVAQKKEVYNASVFTPVNAFTSGVEGPAVDKDGNIYAVNFSKEGTIGKISPDGKAELYVTLPEGSVGNGIRFNSKGEMFIADYTKHNVLKVDPATKNVTVHAHEPTMSQPNDIAIDSRDVIYASDPNWKAGTGRIWRVDTDGTVTLLDSLTGAANGIEVSPDEKTLYVNASGEVLAYDLSANGTVSNRRRLIKFDDFGMDGMRCDVKGNLYITRFGKGTVVKLSPKGEILKEIPLTGKKVTNIAFGGADGRTAYVTLMDRGNLETFSVEDPGREFEMAENRK